MNAILVKLLAFAYVIVCSSALAVEFIELNDHNNDLLPIDTGKSLKIVQDAMQKEYKFDNFAEALKFLNRCKYLIDAVKTVADTDFEGLGGKIKAIVQEPQFVKLCSIDETDFRQKFNLLGAKDMGIQVTLKRLNDLVKLGETLESDADAKLMLENLYEKGKLATSNNLLSHAAEDTTVFFAEQKKSDKYFDLGSMYNSGCEISSIKPICKLVRKSNSNRITALGSDVADFREHLVAKEEAKLDEHVKESGVSLDELKTTCLNIIDNFHAIKIVDKYMEAKFITDDMIMEQCKVEPTFYLYNELHKLCKIVTSTSA